METARFGKNYTRLGTVVLLGLGVVYVLRPFLTALLFAAAVVISSWPLYMRLLTRMRGRRTLAALTMTLSLTLLVIIPIALVAWNLADDIGRTFEQVKAMIELGNVHPPTWLRELPLVGVWLDQYVNTLIASREQMTELAKRMLEPARRILMSGGLILGGGVVQMSMAAFVSFFMYRDGMALMRVLEVGAGRIYGDRAATVWVTVSNTVRGVMYGLLGTALAQALVAALGFAIAGVPAVPLLAVLTFIFSLVPVGPPLIWGGAAVWLFANGSTGWGVFMLLWGVVLISGVDNVVKPILISRGSSQPFLLTFLGVLGGVFAFGFVGLFIGPTVLAVAYSLLRDWTAAGDPGVVDAQVDAVREA
ncbi:AI-2E family transporter [Massilia sp. TWR1-2-2]|uniref:AI-2E family transporter n=1 Tax=Massilia sp. TWR1-2-2 TaxID=2804584 RepID=UPI003CE7EED5